MIDGSLGPQLLTTGVRVVLALGGLGVVVGMSLFGMRLSERQMGKDDWRLYYKKNYQYVVGIPLAVGAAFGLVAFFDITTDKPIDVSILGLHFSGPAGPAVIWMVLFLAIVAAIKLLANGE